MDIFDKCKTDGGYFGQMRAAGDNYFSRPVMEPIPGRVMKFQGKDNIMWSVNNYIGLAESEEIKQVAVEAVKEFGVSAPMGSRMMSGNTKYHLELEQAIADFVQKEAAFLFNYGYLGVLGTVSSLVGPKDVVIMDKLAHACIVDSAFLSRAKVRAFRHNDMNHLESILKEENENRKGGIIILTEGVYGMTGDLADLKGLCALKEKYNARLFIDDAHGWGVMGEHGRGTADYLGVQDKIDLYFGTFAKSFASIGGFTASSKEVMDWIAYNARTQVFAKSLPMVYVKSLRKTLDLVINGDENRRIMWERSNALKDGLRDVGFHIGNGDSPICAVYAPVPGGNYEIGMQMIKYLREKGIFVTGVVYPVIPPGLLMFRMIPTTSHTQEDVDKTIEAFKHMEKTLNIDLSLSDADIEKIDKIYKVQ